MKEKHRQRTISPPAPADVRPEGTAMTVSQVQEGLTPAPLSEAQARMLASWWGGRYACRMGGGEGMRHMVELSGDAVPAEAQVCGGLVVVWNQEEALRWERHRQEINPAAPDWVG